MALSATTSLHPCHCHCHCHCCGASPENGNIMSVRFINPINNFPLSITLPSSRVFTGFKLQRFPSSTSAYTPASKIKDGSPFFATLKLLQSKQAKDFPDETIDSLLIGLTPKEQTIVLKKQKDWRRSLYLFQRMKSTTGYSPNPIHYNVVLRTLGKSMRWDELRLCWIEMANDGVFPTNNTYATLIDAYGKAGLVKEALLWLKHMKSRGVFPDEVSINTAVQVLKDSRQFDLGERLFKSWCDGKVDLDLLQFSNDETTDSDVISPKHFLLTELFKCGGRPSVSQIAASASIRSPQRPRRTATYNTLIDLYGKAGRLKDASDTFLQMLQSGVIPDTLTFNTMINICCYHGHLSEAESLLGKMEEKRVYPDTKTFNIFMTYHASHGNAEDSLKCYGKMKLYRLHPDVVSFRIILQILCEKRMISEVEDVLEEIMKLGSNVDEQSLPVVMKMYLTEGLNDKAFVFFEKHFYSRDISSKNCAAIIDLYAERGLWKEAEDVFMAKKNSRKEVVEYNVMIKAYGKAKLYDKALELFELMRCTGPWPDECTYNSLIQMLSGCDLSEKAKEYLSHMKKAGFTPRCESFSAVIASYCRNRLLSEAVEIYKEMIRCNVKPNALVYGSLVDSFAEAGRIEEAIEYYNIMEKTGIPANCIVLTSLIKAYAKGGFWKEAQGLYGKVKNLEDGPDVIASNCMINLYAGLGMVSEAQLIFDELRKNSRADEVSYAIMMYLYKSMGMLSEATDIAQEVQQSGLMTNCASYNNVMASYVVNGKLKDCGDLLRKMLSQKILPDASTFKVLFTILKKGRLPSEAVLQLESSYREGKPYARQAIVTSVFSTVGLHSFAQKSCEAYLSTGVGLESYAYNAAIGAYGAAGEVDKALNVYMRMQDGGLQPDLVTYVHLAGCYGKAGMVEGLKRIYSLLKYEEIDPSESLYIALINAYRETGRDDLGDLVKQEMRFSIQTENIQVEED